MTADEWNEKYPVGTVVMYRSVSSSDYPWETTRTRSIAWTLGHGAVVVKIEGRAGGVSIEPEHMRVVRSDAILELADRLSHNRSFAMRVIGDTIRDSHRETAEALASLLHDNQTLRDFLRERKLLIESLEAEQVRLKAMESDRNAMLAATRQWQEHPEGWDVPCECETCMSYATMDGGDDDA